MAFSVLLAACGGGGGALGAASPTPLQQGQSSASDQQQPAPGGSEQPATADATTARFSNPTGIVAAANGDVFVVDSGNHTIRRITQSGVVTTIAGAPGARGSEDGTSDAARFNLPTGIAVDRSGVIHVADTENYVIRRITASGSVSKLAGTPGTKGIRNGDTATALFANVLGLTIDAAGDLFVTDGYILPPEPNTIQGSMIVRAINAAGEVTTRAGTFYLESENKLVDGAGADAKFYFSYGLAADAAGNLYVADTGNDAIRRIARDSTVTALVGSAQQIRSPHGVTVDPLGNIYFTDSANHAIRKIAPDGTMTTYAGSVGTQGTADTQ
jgi:sugar lactone lactonase YvrE